MLFIHVCQDASELFSEDHILVEHLKIQKYIKYNKKEGKEKGIREPKKWCWDIADALEYSLIYI